MPLKCHSGTMNLTDHMGKLQRHLATAAGTAGDEGRELADRLIASLDSAARLVLLDILSAAADEITSELAPGSVEVRLRGGEPEFVVTLPPSEEDFDQVASSHGRSVAVASSQPDERGTARLNLRLPETLKQRIEEAAGAEGISLNAWLVRAAGAALGLRGRSPRPGPLGGDRYTGWVR